MDVFVLFACSWCPALRRELSQPDPALQSPCACTAGAAAFCTSSDFAAVFQPSLPLCNMQAHRMCGLEAEVMGEVLLGITVGVQTRTRRR